MIPENAVAVLVLNYNNAALARSFFTKNVPPSYADVRWCLVDNGSSADVQKNLIEFAKEQGWSVWNYRGDSFFPKITGRSKSRGDLVLLPSNLGYAKGNNIGFRFIGKYVGATHVLIANTDVWWESDVVSELLPVFHDDETIVVAAPRVLELSGKEQNPQFLPEKVKMMQTWYRLFLPFSALAYLALSKRYDYHSNISKITHSGRYFAINPDEYSFIGCCFMVDVLKFEKMGFFDPGTFLGTEEPRIMHKLKNAGYKAVILSTTFVHHDQAGSTLHSFASRNVVEFFEKSDLDYLRDYCGYGRLKLWVVRVAGLYYIRVWMPILSKLGRN